MKQRRGVALLASLCVVAMAGCSRESTVWIAGWKEAASMSIARAGAATVVHNGVIYMLGGIDGRDFLRTIEYARIQKDGSLSPWQPGPELNEARGFTDAVVQGDWIYIVGGGNGPNGHHLLRSVERAKIRSDGSLEPWITEKTEMNVPRRCSKVVVTDQAIYSFGGFGGALLDTVERASLAPDGSVGAWRMENEALTMPRYVNGVKAMGRDTYLVGGHDQQRGVGVTSVEWSRIGEAGAFGKWKTTSALTTGRYGLATVVHKNQLYALGGITGAAYVDSIERSERASSGDLGLWVESTALHQPLASFSVVVDNDGIYVIGGTNREGYSQRVHYATFNQSGDIGYSGTANDARRQQENAAARKAAASQLPNSGIVREIMHTQAYSYINVDTPSGTTWLAGPRTELLPGTRIRYSEGVLMSGFFSKELQRTFSEVVFVGTIELEK